MLSHFSYYAVLISLIVAVALPLASVVISVISKLQPSDVPLSSLPSALQN